MDVQFNDLLVLGDEIGGLLKARGEKVAVAESSAGGLLSTALLSVAGASTFYRGGIVIYNRTSIRELAGLEMKVQMAGGVRSSSEPFAAMLAESVRLKLRGDWGLSETGAAGPTGNGYGDDAGHSCCAIAGPTVETFTLETGDSDRAANMLRFAHAALGHFRDRLKA